MIIILKLGNNSYIQNYTLNKTNKNKLLSLNGLIRLSILKCNILNYIIFLFYFFKNETLLNAIFKSVSSKINNMLNIDR